MRPSPFTAALAMLVSFTLFFAAERSSTAAAQTPALDHFETQVRPVLVEHCQKCHGAKKAESSFRVDSRDALLSGGDSGPAVVPGDPAESLLVQAIHYEGLEMPPKQPLSAKQVAAIEQWIRTGAVWPDGETVGPSLGDQELFRELASNHWAFQPIRNPPVPESTQSHPIDQFVEARLRTQGLSLSPSAGPRQLLRRVTFDLTGLPPMPQDFDRLREPSDLQWEREVDRLLASPHFGEHWGRYWLDLARYADTRDWFARGDLNYPFAYTYRDYVVSAFNKNLPFDQFIREQLAADHLTEDAGDPSRAALGFLTVGSRFRNRVDEQIADYIDLVSRGLMGLTVACARCHDHKYDPIPTADYYSLHGVFASSRIPQEFPLLSENVSLPEADLESEYRAEKQKRVDKFNAFLETLRQEGLEDIRKRWRVYLEAFVEVESRKQSLVNAARLHQLKSRAAGAMYVRLFVSRGKPRWQQHPFFGPWARLSIAKSDAKFQADRKQILERESESIHPSMLAILEDGQVTSVATMTSRMGDVLQESMAAGEHDPLIDVRALALDEDGPFVFAAPDMEAHPEAVGSERVRFDKAKRPVTDLEVTHPGAPPRAMVMVDGAPRDSAIQIRGDARRRGDVVPRQFLSLVKWNAADSESPLGRPFQQGSGRLELAEALVHPDNPLTARVIVNWVWRRYFGRGILMGSDFGLRAPEPEHRELMDYLAAGLLRENWDLRWLHRTILTSKTYRQSSQILERHRLADPENEWFGRQTRRRVGYETMRDAMLQVSGRLDRTLHGKPVTDGPGQAARRSLYQKVDRVDFDATRATFDFPRPDAAAIERLETTVPQQLLFALNSKFVVECAQAVAGAPEFLRLTSDRERIEWLYQRVLQRSATAAEQALFASFHPQASSESVRPIWSWGFGTGNSRDHETCFRPLPHFDGNAYRLGKEFPDRTYGHVQLTRMGGHPGNQVEAGVIVRWISPIEGEIRIQGRLAHESENGDGVRARTIHEGEVLKQWDVKAGDTPTAFPRRQVRVGDIIDFVVDCGAAGSSNSDSYQWNQIVTVLKSDSRHFPVGHQWNARAMFGAPPQPKLNRWELAAQALLISNEFFYID